jgi:hypothetical protein
MMTRYKLYKGKVSCIMLVSEKHFAPGKACIQISGDEVKDALFGMVPPSLHGTLTTLSHVVNLAFSRLRMQECWERVGARIIFAPHLSSFPGIWSTES